MFVYLLRYSNLARPHFENVPPVERLTPPKQSFPKCGAGKRPGPPTTEERSGVVRGLGVASPPSYLEIAPKCHRLIRTIKSFSLGRYQALRVLQGSALKIRAH